MMVQCAYFIIWNSSKRNFDSICSEIEKNTIVKSKKNIEIKKYYNLICDLYEFNNQRELGVYKATKMCNSSKYEIVILDIEFYSKESSDFFFVKTLKKNIRNVKVNIKMYKKLKIKMYKKFTEFYVDSDKSESIFILSFNR